MQTSNFIGEETSSMPPPSPLRSEHSRSFGRDSSPMVEDPSQWTQEQQQRMMQTILGGGGQMPSAGGENFGQDPLQAMMEALLNPQGSGVPNPANGSSQGQLFLPPGFPTSAPGMMPPNPMMQGFAPPPPRTLFQKLAPLLHIFSTILLLLFFVIRFEPSVHSSLPNIVSQGLLERWAGLRWASGSVQGVVSLYSVITAIQR